MPRGARHPGSTRARHRRHRGLLLFALLRRACVVDVVERIDAFSFRVIGQFPEHAHRDTGRRVTPWLGTGNRSEVVFNVVASFVQRDPELPNLLVCHFAGALIRLVQRFLDVSERVLELEPTVDHLPTEEFATDLSPRHRPLWGVLGATGIVRHRLRHLPLRLECLRQHTPGVVVDDVFGRQPNLPAWCRV